MIRLVYTSSSVKDWHPKQLLGLLKQCRKNNSAKDITGILLYSNQTFFQVLEGEEDTVEEMFELIKKDKRHKNVTIIEKKDINNREFPYWNMGYQKIDKHDLENIEGYESFYENEFNPAGFLAHKGIISPLMKMIKNKLVSQVAETGEKGHEELPLEHEDPFIQLLHRTIRVGVKCLALLMVIVMIIGGADVVYIIYNKIMLPPQFLLTIDDMLVIFGGFLTVLIAIEIFLNITLYIRSDIIPVKLVVATALMAICRKVIVFDYNLLAPEYIVATAFAVMALGITYWLIQKKE